MVTRFRPDCFTGYAMMEEYDKGEYVLYSDYRSAINKTSKLNEHIKVMEKELDEQNRSTHAQNLTEKLRKSQERIKVLEDKIKRLDYLVQKIESYAGTIEAIIKDARAEIA